jgi:hypothetical protein
MLLQKQEFPTLTPYDDFVYALKARETRRQYPNRIDQFFISLRLEGTIPENANFYSMVTHRLIIISLV